MGASLERMNEFFCVALQMKERMKGLYEEAMRNCADVVGKETFKMLRDAEDEDIGKLNNIYADVKKGYLSGEVCGLYGLHGEDRGGFLRALAEERGLVGKACLDDVAAVDSGLHLENEGIGYFESQLAGASSGVEKDFLERLVEGERGHYRVLADLRYYFSDPEGWFIEKGAVTLDGSGAFT